MSGFKDDVISILRDNIMLHAEASGWIVQQHILPKTSALLKDLQDRKMAVIGRHRKPLFLFDFIVISVEHLTVNWLLESLAKLTDNGIIIMEIENFSLAISNDYVSKFANFSAHKVRYDDRFYLVIKKGVDYGN